MQRAFHKDAVLFGILDEVMGVGQSSVFYNNVDTVKTGDEMKENIWSLCATDMGVW